MSHRRNSVSPASKQAFIEKSVRTLNTYNFDSTKPPQWRNNWINTTPSTLSEIFAKCTENGKMNLILWDLINRCRFVNNLMCSAVWTAFSEMLIFPVRQFDNWFTKSFYRTFVYDPNDSLNKLISKLVDFILEPYQDVLSDTAEPKPVLVSAYRFFFVRISNSSLLHMDSDDINTCIMNRHVYGHRYTVWELEKELLAAWETVSGGSDDEDESSSSDSSDSSSDSSSSSRSNSPVRH
jgi:hypothetical protein